METPGARQISVGGGVASRAKVRLGPLSPNEVAVELYAGRVDAHENITGAIAVRMQATGREGDLHVFETSYGPCAESGLHGYTVRVAPLHPNSIPVIVPGCITWAAAQ